ncbi:MAG: hypothetical protein IRZ14_17655 [Chloroflexi bacterium]|nr:hypothetical protein [Chloroflexota bacterium]
MVDPAAPFVARLDRLEAALRAGDCSAAMGELAAIGRDGPDALVRAGLSQSQIEALQRRFAELMLLGFQRC